MQNILRKMSISVMVSLLVLVTFGAITFAWVGISTYSRIENFDLDLEVQELKEYGLEISLTGLENSKAAIFVTVEPLVGTLVGILLWHEEITLFKACGILFIFMALLFNQKD